MGLDLTHYPRHVTLQGHVSSIIDFQKPINICFESFIRLDVSHNKKTERQKKGLLFLSIPEDEEGVRTMELRMDSSNLFISEKPLCFCHYSVATFDKHPFESHTTVYRTLSTLHKSVCTIILKSSKRKFQIYFF